MSLVGVIDTPKLSTDDRYDMTALYDSLLAFLVLVYFVVMPGCILNKIPSIRRRVKSYFGLIAGVEEGVEDEGGAEDGQQTDQHNPMRKEIVVGNDNKKEGKETEMSPR